MYRGKPIIGIVGGIGSGKSFVASLFGELGCLVIDSDRLIAQVYQREDVRQTLRQWWGPGVFDPAGGIDRQAIAGRVFDDAEERHRLESLLFPLASQLRDEQMAASGPDTVGYVWDAPLLIEAGLADRCDAIVYVDVPDMTRAGRVMESRGWTMQEWQRREKTQLPLDKKRKMAKYMLRNTAGADEVRSQVRELLSRIVADMCGRECQEA